MSENLATKLRSILSRKLRTEEDATAYIDDLEQVIRSVEQLQMDASRAMLRRRREQQS